jgi:hypothetical protein
MKGPLRTVEVADLLDTNVERLISLVRRRRIKPAPPRDSAGRFQWGKEDVERARKVIQVLDAVRASREK